MWVPPAVAADASVHTSSTTAGSAGGGVGDGVADGVSLGLTPGSVVGVTTATGTGPQATPASTTSSPATTTPASRAARIEQPPSISPPTEGAYAGTRCRGTPNVRFSADQQRDRYGRAEAGVEL